MTRVYGNGEPRGVPGQAIARMGLVELLLSYGPEFLYKLNETGGATPVDVSGHGAAATLIGSPSGSATGGPNSSMGKLTLNGTSQYWKTDRGTTGADYSLVTHVKTTDTVGYLATSRSASGQIGIAAIVGTAAVNPPGPGAIALGSSGDGKWWGRKTTTTINDGNWHQVILTADTTSGSAIAASSFEVCIDGVNATDADTTYSQSTSPFNGTPWAFGNGIYGGDLFLACDMSVTAGFAYALTAGQKAAIYAASR